MKTALLIIVFLSLWMGLCAVEAEYDIGTFKPLGLLEYSLTPYLSDFQDYQYYQKESNLNYLYTNLRLPGSLLWDNEKHYLKVDVSIRPGYTRSKHTVNYDFPTGINDIKSENVELYEDASAEYRNYSGMIFYGASLISSMTNTNEKYKQNSDLSLYTRNNTSQQNANQLSLAMGYGRIYQCQQAYTAWIAMQELSKYDCLRKPYTSEDINNLANMLYSLRNFRELDDDKNYRHKVKQLIDYLITQVYPREGSETKAIAILLNTWSRGSSVRLVGTKIEAKPFAYIKNQKEKRNDVTDNVDTLWTDSASETTKNSYYAKGGLELSLAFQRPYHNVFQLSSNTNIQQGWFDAFLKENGGDSLRVIKKPFSFMKEEIALSYCPNNRSSLTLSFANQPLA